MFIGLGLGTTGNYLLGGTAGAASSDGLAWANLSAGNALDAWDFLTDQARFNSVAVGPLANTPGWSFTRASTGYAATSAGVLTAFSSGALRRTDKGVLIEGARTNLALWSDDWTNAAWTKTNCTAALDQTGPDNVANSATRLTATAGNATALQSITSGSATRAASVYIKRLTGSGNIQMTVDGGTGWTTLTVTSSWTQVMITQAAVTNPNFGLRIVTSGDAVAVKFGMVENASFQSSPIPTTTASATRAADVLTVPVSGIDYPLTLFAQFSRAVDTGGTEEHLRVKYVDNNNMARIGVSGSDLSFCQATAASSDQGTTSITGAISVGVTTKHAWRVSTDSIRGAKSGALSAEDTTVTVPTGPTLLDFGSTNPPFGYIERIALWTRALSDGELQSLTT